MEGLRESKKYHEFKFSKPIFLPFFSKIKINEKGASSPKDSRKSKYILSTVDASGKPLSVSLMTFPKAHEWILNPQGVEDKSYLADYFSFYSYRQATLEYAPRAQYCTVFLRIYEKDSMEEMYLG